METHIVIINNDESMQDLFTLCLERVGYHVSSYTYAHIDLAKLEQHRPDLIILDFNHENHGIGWRFLQLLKMEDVTAKTPILVSTTAFTLSAEIRGYLLSRHITVIPSPFVVKSLVTLVEKTLTQANQAGVIFSSDRNLPILVVDDMEALNDAITLVLRLEGYQVVTAFNGLSALEILSQGDYCLILLDIDMPIMNGFEFLAAYDRQLRPHSPVIIVSGQKDIWTRVLPSFVVDVLLKPFEITQLLKLVDKFAQPV